MLTKRKAWFEYFAGATSKDILHHIDWAYWQNIYWQNHFFEVAIIHISVTDIISNRNSADFDHVLKNIKNVSEVYNLQHKENFYSWVVSNNKYDIRR